MFLNECAELESLPNGLLRYSAYLRPIAYRLDGALQRILSAWQDGDATWPNIIVGASFLAYARNGLVRVCPTRDPLRYLEFGRPYRTDTWAAVPLANLSRSDNQLVSTNANYNVSVTMGGHFIDLFDVEFKNGFVPPNNQVAYPIGLSGLDRQGSVLLADGVPVMSVRQPVVVDAANPFDVRAAAYDFVARSGQTFVVFTLPSMTGMARPTLDPTLELQPAAAAGKDAGIQFSNPTTNYGNSTMMGTRAGLIANSKRSLVQFDLSGIPVGATLSAVTLTLTSDWPVNKTLYAYRILPANDWLEAEATWNVRQTATAWAGANGLGTAGTDYDAVVAGSASNFAMNTPKALPFSADGVADVQAWVSGAAANRGLLIFNNDQAWDLNLYTSDSATPGYRPKITVDYTLGCPRQALYYGRQRR